MPTANINRPLNWPCYWCFPLCHAASYSQETIDGKDVCSPESRSTDEGFQDCLQAIRYTMQDPAAFWFGFEYLYRCPVPDNSIECQNFLKYPTSLAQRLFPIGNDISSLDGVFNASTITSYLDIVIHEKPGEILTLSQRVFVNGVGGIIMDTRYSSIHSSIFGSFSNP